MGGCGSSLATDKDDKDIPYVKAKSGPVPETATRNKHEYGFVENNDYARRQGPPRGSANIGAHGGVHRGHPDFSTATEANGGGHGPSSGHANPSSYGAGHREQQPNIIAVAPKQTDSELRETIQKKDEELQKQNERLKQQDMQIENLKSELNQKRSSAEPPNKPRHHTDASNDKKDLKIKTLKQKVQKAENEVEKLDAKCDQLDKLYKDTKKTLEETKAKLDESKTKLEDATKRMASSMSDALSRDETNLENINVKNRPMTILDEFSLFCNNQWLDAKEVLDNLAEEHSLREEDICRLLTEVMFDCYAMARKLLSAVQVHFEDVLTNPMRSFLNSNLDMSALLDSILTSKISDNEKPIKEIKLDSKFMSAVITNLRLASDNVDFSKSAKSICDQFLETRKLHKFRQVADEPEVVDYFTQCMKISWHMVIQQPAMHFACNPGEGGKFDENKHELHFGSAPPTNPDAQIHYYIHPAMFHGEKQMKKARVILRIQAWDEEEKLAGPKTKRKTDRKKKKVPTATLR